MRTEERIRQLIHLVVIEEMNVTNMISQGPPETWVPLFIETLSKRLNELVLDEIAYGRK